MRKEGISSKEKRSRPIRPSGSSFRRAWCTVACYVILLQMCLVRTAITTVQERDNHALVTDENVHM